MKKTYQKPVVLIENLSITEMIAAGCDLIFDFVYDMGCEPPTPEIGRVWDIPDPFLPNGGYLFIVNYCGNPVGISDSDDGYCYHEAVGEIIFSS